jgi:hypothetical protein
MTTIVLKLTENQIKQDRRKKLKLEMKAKKDARPPSSVEYVKKYYNTYKEYLTTEKSIKKVYEHYIEYMTLTYPSIPLINEYKFRTHLRNNGYKNS